MDKYITDKNEIGLLFTYVESITKALKEQNKECKRLSEIALKIHVNLLKCDGLTPEQSKQVDELNKQINSLNSERKYFIES